MIALKNKSQLVLVDMQEKLASVMPKEVINKITKRCELLFTVAQRLEIPYNHYRTISSGIRTNFADLLKLLLSEASYIEKKAFACTDDAIFNRYLIRTKPQVFLIGMEAHICILQQLWDSSKLAKKFCD